MNKFVFRFLVFLMSVSLLGIILVQVYWFNSSLEKSEEQFTFHVKQVLENVVEKIERQEKYKFLNRYNFLRDSTGKRPKREDFLEYKYVQRNVKTNQTIIYSNSITMEDYDIQRSFFDKGDDTTAIKNYTTKRKTAVFNGKPFDDSGIQTHIKPDITIEREGTIDIMQDAQFDAVYKDIAIQNPIQERVSADNLSKLLAAELKGYGINTPFEFNIYSNGLATKVKSEHFNYDKYSTYTTPIFIDNDGNNRYNLLLNFPQKKKFLFAEILAITLLSIVFTLIIIIAYANALHQLIKQRQISEIKTDFINNMTHEFKTPIATINLALDAIRNPKVIDDKDKVYRYLQMIRDENKRMHAQVENVLRISKLEKKELDISKEPHDVHEIIEDAIEHVNLIVEDRNGKITSALDATRSTVLLNDVHFTNVIVNILDNAIKYSTAEPVIEINTENIKDFILIRIKDNGIGMSKTAQKRIFEKFYREHTGDVHNVKGHGLGLAYVKRIVDDHNSQIFVESEKGKGSTFIIKVPLIN